MWSCNGEGPRISTECLTFSSCLKHALLMNCPCEVASLTSFYRWRNSDSEKSRDHSPKPASRVSGFKGFSFHSASQECQVGLAGPSQLCQAFSFLDSTFLSMTATVFCCSHVAWVCSVCKHKGRGWPSEGAVQNARKEKESSVLTNFCMSDPHLEPDP